MSEMKKIIKKAAAVAAAQLMLIFSIPVFPASAEAAPEYFNNIVLFAQFESLSESNFMENRVEAITELCSGENTFHSLSGYIDAISYGQLNVTSCFPQLKDGVITPYVLTSAESGYSNCEQLAAEILRNTEVAEDIPLDGNSDGVVDNIIFVVDGKASDQVSILWPKAFSLSGYELNGLKVNRVNIQNSSQLFDNLVTGGEGVLCHEFLHSLGYPDLYRQGRTGTPVGLWDVMASNSVFLQYPLAYQRAAVSGWLDSADITSDGTYTLAPASADSGNRLYLLKTPLSDTEFFALEYRRQGAKYSDELDVKIYGTGLVVYRINTEEDGNHKGERDEIYVFRPGETELDAGEGDMFSSNYGGDGAPDTIGSLDWNDGIADGALVYSNGTNSGIKISNIIMDEDSLTFSAEFADTAEVRLWESVSGGALSGFMPYQLAASDDGTVYMVGADSGYARIYRIDGGEAISVGQPLGTGTYADMNQPRLALCGNTPYVLYQDRDFILHLCRYEPSSESWTEVYKGEKIAQYAALTSYGDKLYIAYTTGSFPYSLHTAEYSCSEGTVTVLGGVIADNGCNMSAAVAGGAPAVAYRDISDGNRPKLAVYENGAWKITAVSDNSCGAVYMVSDGAALWIAPCGSGNSVYRMQGDQLTEYPLPASVSENAFIQIPVMADGKCCLAVNTQNPDELVVYELDGDSWEPLGNVLASDVVNSLSLAYNGTNLYCSFFTSNGTPIIRSLRLNTSEAVAGDVNADGVFSIADVVMMQNWIFGRGTLTDWKAGDLYADETIDIYDLCLMRDKLLKQKSE